MKTHLALKLISVFLPHSYNVTNYLLNDFTYNKSNSNLCLEETKTALQRNAKRVYARNVSVGCKQNR